MRKKGCIVCVAALLISLLAACAPGEPANGPVVTDYMQAAAEDWKPWNADSAEETTVTGMKLAASKDGIELHMDPETTDFALRHVQSGRVVHGNPLRENPDLSIHGDILGEWASNLVIRCYDGSMNEKVFNTRDDAIAYRQFSLYALENGIRVVYKLGQDASSKLTPPVMSEATYDSVYQQLNARQQRALKSCYKLLETEEMTNGVPSEYIDKAKYLSMYPILRTTNIYAVRELSAYQERQLTELLQEIGFTYEQMEAEKAWAGYSDESKSICFVIPLDLTIRDGGLCASINADLIGVPDGYTLHQISVLCGFHAGEKQGEFVLPDGSGALMPMSGANGATYTQNVYSLDGAYIRNPVSTWEQPVVLPVFGSSTEAGSLLAAVTSGEAVSRVVARQWGGTNPVAAAYTTFVYTEVDDKNKETGDTTVSLMPASAHVKGPLSVQYFILPGKQSYAQLAVRYRTFLESKGLLTPMSSSRRALMLDLYGAMDIQQTKWGRSVRELTGLTTFEQAQKICDAISQKGVSALTVRYLGVTEGGIQNQVVDAWKIPKCLGGLKQWQSLQSYAQAHQMALYPDANLTSVYKDGLLDGFSVSEDASKRVDYKSATAQKSYMVSGVSVKTCRRYMLTPVSILENAQRLANDLKQKKQTTLAVSTMGKELQSDFGLGRFTSRVEAQAYVTESLAELSRTVSSLLIETGNLYAAAYADTIVGLPNKSSGLGLERESVPFVQIVLSGSVSYASGAPFNSTGELWKRELEAIETGSLVYYHMMGEDNLLLKGSDYEDLGSMQYTLWLEAAASSWKRVEAALAPAAGARMMDHQKVGEHCYATAYDNGIRIYVNYGHKEQKIDGLTVPAQGYATGGAAQ